MDLLNMTNSVQLYEFYKKVKEEIFITQTIVRCLTYRMNVGNKCKISAQYLQTYAI